MHDQTLTQFQLIIDYNRLQSYWVYHVVIFCAERVRWGHVSGVGGQRGGSRRDPAHIRRRRPPRVAAERGQRPGALGGWAGVAESDRGGHGGGGEAGRRNSGHPRDGGGGREGAHARPLPLHPAVNETGQPTRVTTPSIRNRLFLFPLFFLIIILDWRTVTQHKTRHGVSFVRPWWLVLL